MLIPNPYYWQIIILLHVLVCEYRADMQQLALIFQGRFLLQIHYISHVIFFHLDTNAIENLQKLNNNSNNSWLYCPFRAKACKQTAGITPPF